MQRCVRMLRQAACGNGQVSRAMASLPEAGALTDRLCKSLVRYRQYIAYHFTSQPSLGSHD